MLGFPLLIAVVAAAGAGEPPSFAAEERTDLLHFSYGWPAEVEAEPTLRARLAGELEAARDDARRTAEQDRAGRGGDFPFNAHDYEKAWRIAGGTDRFLSLAASTHSYTGGAHGNLTFSAILWDRRADRAAEPAALLGAGALERLTPRYCEALDAERAGRRGDPVQRDPEDPFAACPALAGQVLAPADTDGDGRFDTLEVLIPPYVAGPWVEGPYVLEVALREEDLAGLAAQVRDSFEAR